MLPGSHKSQSWVDCNEKHCPSAKSVDDRPAATLFDTCIVASVLFDLLDEILRLCLIIEKNIRAKLWIGKAYIVEGLITSIHRVCTLVKIMGIEVDTNVIFLPRALNFMYIGHPDEHKPSQQGSDRPIATRSNHYMTLFVLCFGLDCYFDGLHATHAAYLHFLFYFNNNWL